METPMAETTDPAKKLPRALDGKIENDGKKAPEKEAARSRQYEVMISFDGLDKGDVFTDDDADRTWAERHVQTGYLRVLNGDEPGREVPDGVGEVRPR